MTKVKSIGYFDIYESNGLYDFWNTKEGPVQIDESSIACWGGSLESKTRDVEMMLKMFGEETA